MARASMSACVSSGTSAMGTATSALFAVLWKSEMAGSVRLSSTSAKRDARAYGKGRARTQRTAAVSEPKRCPGLEPLDDTDQFFDMGCLEPGERGEKRADPVAEPGARAARPGLLNPDPDKAPPGRRVAPGVGEHAERRTAGAK